MITEIPHIGFTIDEAAQALRITKEIILPLIVSGEIPARRVGENVLIHPAAIEKWLVAGTPPKGPHIRGCPHYKGTKPGAECPYCSTFNKTMEG